MTPANRFLGLDTLRGCAVIAVLVFHYLNNTSVLRTQALLPLQAATENLFYGVDLFFVLSGFFIGASLMRGRGVPGALEGYFVQRAARILPLYALWLGIFLVMVAFSFERLSGAFPWLLDSGGVPLWSYLVFGQNLASAKAGSWGPAWLGITWTLAIEMQFYVLAAIVVALVPVRYVGLVALAIVVLAAEIKRHGIGGYGHPQMVLTTSRLDAPFAGVFCAWLFRFSAVQSFIARHQRLIVPTAIALMALHYGNGVYGWLSIPVSSLTLNAIVFGVAVLAFAGAASEKANPIVRGLRWCGVRCYAIYLFHVGVLGLCAHLIFNLPPNVFSPGQGWPAVIAATFVTLALAAVSWRLIERPIIAWAQAFAASRRQA